MQRYVVWLAFVATACVGVSCGQGPRVGESPLGSADAGLVSAVPAPAAQQKAKTISDSPSSLRAATIAAAQREAGQRYAVHEEAGALRAEARGFSVRYDAKGAHLGARGAEYGALVLKSVGCEGALAPVSAARPSFVANRVAFARQAVGASVEEWYLTGPMGLEQGFTLGELPACAQGDAKVVLEVAADGLSVSSDGDALVLEATSGERYRYSDVFAKDATGAALPARMEWTAEGRIALVMDTSAAVFPVEVDPLVWAEEEKLLAPDGAANDYFGGYGLALNGTTAVVGVPWDDDSGSSSGSAYVFVRSGTTWALQQKLAAPDGVTLDWFGHSVALDGDTTVIGASNTHNNGVTGSAYVFVRVGTSWSLQQKLVATGGTVDDGLGTSVSLSGDTVLAGAPGSSYSTGCGYVFVRTGSVWSQEAKIKASGGAQWDWFGAAVSLQGNTAVVGAWGDDDNGAESGSAYIFTRSGAIWSQQQKLTASDAAAGDWFGSSVALDNGTALIGASKDDAKAPDCGSAYVFTRSGVTWSQEGKLTAADANQTDALGTSVALSGDRALVGAPYNGLTKSGSAYVFQRTGTSWAQLQKVTAPAGSSLARFGSAAAITSDRALVGEMYDDIGTNADQGSVHAFVLKKSDGDACSAESECASGFCTDGVCCNTACSGGTVDCQACSTAAGAAADGTCGPRSNNTFCDDSDACTQTDTCQSGTCTGSSPVTCAAQDECHDVGACNSSTGTCSNPAKPDGTTCSTGTCQSGGCQSSGTGGTGGTSTGGTGATGGTSTGGTSAGGTGGSATGGSAGAATGGTAGAPTGGTSAGGSAGAATGGNAGAAASGSAGASDGGSAGASTGGASTGGSGGIATGGSSTGGTSTGGASIGGSAGSGTGGAKSSSSGDDGGCGCRAAGGERGDGVAWLVLALGLAVARRRRSVAMNES